MKKVIAYIVSPLAYAAGHITSKTFKDWVPDRVLDFTFKVYAKCMDISGSIEEWAGVEVMWHPCEAEREGYYGD